MGGAIAPASRVSTAERRAKRALDAGARRRHLTCRWAGGGFRFGQVRCSVTAGAVAPAGSGGAVAPAGSGGAVATAGSGAAVATAGSGGAVAPAGSGAAVAPAGSGAAVATAGSGAGVGVEVPPSKDFNTFFNRLQYLLQYRFNRVQGRLQAN